MVRYLICVAVAVAALGGGWTLSASAEEALYFSVLPIPEPPVPFSTVLDARDATPPPRFEAKAPEGAPNVLIVLLDDMGFGQSSAFGGPIDMPTIEALANDGLRFNEFHTTALCSPTRDRASDRAQPSHEQHGRHHRGRHRFPWQHRTAAERDRPARGNAAPQRLFDRRVWQKRRGGGRGAQRFGADPPMADVSGFEKFYGFLGGETNQWSPRSMKT